MVVTSTGAVMEISRLIQRSMDWVLGRNDIERAVAVRQDDPARLRVGDTLRVRLVYQGQPLIGIRVHSDVVDSAGSRPAATGAGQSASSANGSTTDYVTGADGLIRVPISRAGLWNVRTIHIVQADATSGADWDAHWATLVFSAAARR